MRTILFLSLSCFSVISLATRQPFYTYYQTNSIVNNGNETFIVYITKKDPCINIDYVKTGETIRYCEVDNIGSDLFKDSEDYTANEFDVEPDRFNYVVSGLWDDQLCTITISTKALKCIHD